MYKADSRCSICAGVGAVLVRGRLERCSCVRKVVAMKALIVAVAVLVLCSCAPADPGRDVVTTPTDSGCASVNGAAACSQFVGALCARLVMCCGAVGAHCPSWGNSDADCRGFYVTNGLDCAAPSRTSTTVCQNAVDTCVTDIPLIACSDVLGGTVNFPAACSVIP